jgi:nucleotide-binding universal stress UspA family protein
MQVKAGYAFQAKIFN